VAVAIASTILIGACGSASREPAGAGSSVVSTASTTTPLAGLEPSMGIPDVVGDYGFWVNGAPALLVPVVVAVDATATVTFDRVDPDSSVDVLVGGTGGFLREASADNQGRVTFSIDTHGLGPGVHEIWVDGSNGGPIGFNGRIKVPGVPVAGSRYTTVLCCLPDADDHQLELNVNGTDLSDLVSLTPKSDGSVLFTFPIPRFEEHLVIQIRDTVTGDVIEERTATALPR
jgi:hypothetical protein